MKHQTAAAVIMATAVAGFAVAKAPDIDPKLPAFSSKPNSILTQNSSLMAKWSAKKSSNTCKA